jgi:TatD DNase family protein
MFIDTHCHLDAAAFNDEPALIVQEAHKQGVTRIVLPTITQNNFVAVQQLSAQIPHVSPAFGIHPLHTGVTQQDDLDALRDMLAQHQAVAVGEIGLDFYVEHYDQPKQESYFREQLKIARSFDLPVLLHIRHAQDTVLKHLRCHPVSGGIAHAFNGSMQQANAFISLGFKLGFGGAMTHPRALRIRELAATLPLDSIVLETDAPNIPPLWVARGRPNTPAQLPRIAQVLADLRGVSVAEIAQATTANALAVLPKLAAYNRAPH